jgi:hypothetical protein
LQNIIASRETAADIDIAGRRFRGVRIAEADILLALPEQGPLAITNQGTNVASGSEYLGKDGVLVQLGSSWSEANMRLQPHLRSR